MNGIELLSKSASLACQLLIAATFLTVAPLHAEISSPLITNVARTNGSIVLSWARGRPTYQVQTSPSLGGNWTNIGPTTTNTFMTLSASSSGALFRVVSDYTAQYQVAFNGIWSQQTHPIGWMTNTAHFTGLVGGVHGPAVHFWRTNEYCTEGIRLMAQYGQKPTLLAEVGTAITNGTADFQLSGPNLNPTPGTVNFTFPQPMRRDFPLVTLCSMIGPSPDWFVGVESLNLLQNGRWTPNLSATLYAMDAGTLTTTNLSFVAPYAFIPPILPISQITGFPTLQNGNLVPFATFVFTRLD